MSTPTTLVPPRDAAEAFDLTRGGTLALLRKTGLAVRRDGYWYVARENIDQLAHAPQPLRVPSRRGFGGGDRTVASA
jgi:hypothetical protein